MSQEERGITRAEKDELLADLRGLLEDVPLEVRIGRQYLEKYGGHKHSRDEGLAIVCEPGQSCEKVNGIEAEIDRFFAEAAKIGVGVDLGNLDGDAATKAFLDLCVEFKRRSDKARGRG